MNNGKRNLFATPGRVSRSSSLSRSRSAAGQPKYSPLARKSIANQTNNEWKTNFQTKISNAQMSDGSIVGTDKSRKATTKSSPLRNTLKLGGKRHRRRSRKRKRRRSRRGGTNDGYKSKPKGPTCQQKKDRCLEEIIKTTKEQDAPQERKCDDAYRKCNSNSSGSSSNKMEGMTLKQRIEARMKGIKKGGAYSQYASNVAHSAGYSTPNTFGSQPWATGPVSKVRYVNSYDNYNHYKN